MVAAHRDPQPIALGRARLPNIEFKRLVMLATQGDHRTGQRLDDALHDVLAAHEPRHVGAVRARIDIHRRR